MDYLISEPEMEHFKEHIKSLSGEITILKETLAAEQTAHREAIIALHKVQKQLNIERETTKLVLSKLHELNSQMSKCYSEPIRITFDQLV